MTKSTSFILGDRFNRFIADQIEQGRFASASEVVRAGLRMLEDEAAYTALLRAALVEGEESGPPEHFDMTEFLAVKRAELHNAE